MEQATVQMTWYLPTRENAKSVAFKNERDFRNMKTKCNVQALLRSRPLMNFKNLLLNFFRVHNARRLN